LVICHGTSREGLPGNADRMRMLTKAGALGIITIADPGFTVEPPRWPFAYSRRVVLAGTPTVTIRTDKFQAQCRCVR
jgi:hypothetical protein